jgi:hypothetical protein
MKQGSLPMPCPRFLEMPVTIEFLAHLPGCSACQKALRGIDDTFVAEVMQHARKIAPLN